MKKFISIYIILVSTFLFECGPSATSELNQKKVVASSDDSLKALADKRAQEVFDSLKNVNRVSPSEIDFTKDSIFFADNFTSDTIISKIYFHTISDAKKTIGIDSISEEDWSLYGVDLVEMAYATEYKYRENGIQKYFLILQGEAGHMHGHTGYKREYFWLHKTKKGWYLANHFEENVFDTDVIDLFKLNDGSIILQESGYSENHVWEEQICFSLLKNDSVKPIYYNAISKSNTAQIECMQPDSGVACDCFSIVGTATIDHQKGKSYFVVTENLAIEQFATDSCENVGSLKSVITNACRNGHCVIIKQEDQQTDSTMKTIVLNSEKTFLRELAEMEKANK